MDKIEKEEKEPRGKFYKSGGNIINSEHYKASVVDIKKQYFPHSKRIIKPAFSKYEFNISKQW